MEQNKIVLPEAEKILILDFGSQYTQLIARKVRELNVFCEIHPYNDHPDVDSYKGVILSGSPCSVRDKESPRVNADAILEKMPVLGLCYGAQLLAHLHGGEIEPSRIREYGRAHLNYTDPDSDLFKGVSTNSQVWMSHGDTILTVPDDFEVVASTEDVHVAGYKVRGKRAYGIQFHPEVAHTLEGKTILKNFLVDICGCSQDWTPEHFVDITVEWIREQVQDGQVVLGLSGGVDSTVAAMLIDKAIHERLHCIFVDNGLLRKYEFDQVLEAYKHLGLNITGVDAKDEFLNNLKGISDPEEKRKVIGRTFIDVFDREAHKIQNVKWLGQGTIYPDVIESVSVKGPSATIKSHHNVGGLPEKMHLKTLEPLRALFKDEVRKVGHELEVPEAILNRHPFPGPGLAIRILGDITPEKVRMVQEADKLFIDGLKKDKLYENIWQAGAILLPVHSVGVMGDERTYEQVICLRAVTSTDGMTADWVHLPYDFMARISNQIINKIKGINRVVYDISSKPPATIEWE